MKKYGGFVPGIRPGKPTADYLDFILSRITLPGAMFLMVVALVPLLVLVTAPLRRSIDAAITFYRPTEGWFNQTLRGEIVMGAVDPDEPAAVNQHSSWAFLQRTAALMLAGAVVSIE